MSDQDDGIATTVRNPMDDIKGIAKILLTDLTINLFQVQHSLQLITLDDSPFSYHHGYSNSMCVGPI